jgi:O-antigen/teichoic acid export membrane protein
MFGAKFLYSGELLIYSWPFLIINALYTINFGILAGLGKVKERVKVLGMALVANVLINILLLYVFKIGLIWAVIAMIIWWIILRRRSLKIIQKNLKISFNRAFFTKNLVVIVLCSSVFFVIKGNYFIINDIVRLQNIQYLLIAILSYYIVLGGINYKSIKLLVNEIKSIKK